MSALLEAVQRWRAFRAVVVGDFMLDQLVSGDAERLSPDAPVPILRVRRIEDRPGGAANVCLDLAALRGRVAALGVVGRDAAGSALRSALEREGVDGAGLVEDASRPTTLKQNLIGLAQARHPQKMFRVDHESCEPLAERVLRDLLACYEAALEGAQVVCLEDYAKGVCTPELCRRVIELARRAGVPVMVDPARIADYSKYHGATVMTPNRSEAELATGLATDDAGDSAGNARVARRLLESLDLEAAVLTLDRHGALLLERGGEPEAAPTVAREVYDVSGAGDMFLAGLAAARANGLSWSDSVRLANIGAGLEVEVFGVQPIPLERIHHALLTQQPGGARTLEQVRVEIEARRQQARRDNTPFRVVFTNGCFDILHPGHVSLIQRAAREGEMLVVGVNSDASVRRLKGPGRPVNTQESRVGVLSSLKYVDAVVVFEEDTPIDLIQALRPDALVKGADYTEDRVVGAEFVRSYGGRVVLADVIPGQSTTRIVNRLASPSVDSRIR